MNRDRFAFILLLVVILTAAFLLRTIDPEADAPFNLDFSQGINTDSFWYLNEAYSRSGCANFDPDLGRDYRRPFFSLYADLFFKAFGCTLTQINKLSVLPGLLIVLLVTLLVKRVLGQVLGLIAGWLVTTNFSLIFFSRTPNLYVWVVVVHLLAIYLLTLDTKTLAKPYLKAGASFALIVFASFYLKDLSVIFLFPLILTVALGFRKQDEEKRSQIKWGKYLLGTLGISLIFLFFIWNEFIFTIDRVQRALFRYSYNPLDLQRLLLEVVNLWRTNWTFFYSKMPFLFLSALCSFFFIAKNIRRKKLSKIDLYFAASFFLAHCLGLFLAYRPSRFFLFLVPSTVYLSLKTVPILIEWIEKSGLIKKFSKPSRMLIPISCFFIVTLQSLTPFKEWYVNRTYTVRESIEDFQQIVPPHAVVVGKNAHLLTFNSARVAKDLYIEDLIQETPQPFNNNEIYVVIDQNHNIPNFASRTKDWTLLDTLWIRGFSVKVYRFSPGVSASQTLYERGINAYMEGKTKVSQEFLLESHREFKQAGSAIRLLQTIAYHENEPENLQDKYFDEALERNPNHPFIFYLKLARGIENEKEKLSALNKVLFFSGFSSEYVAKINALDLLPTKN